MEVNSASNLIPLRDKSVKLAIQECDFHFSCSPRGINLKNSKESIFENETEIMKGCAVLSDLMRMRRSFSTGDIIGCCQENAVMRYCDSEPCTINEDDVRSNHAGFVSRAVSTWVAVGDIQEISQLASSQGRCSGEYNYSAFSAIDLVRTVNKITRHSYLTKWVMFIYKAFMCFIKRNIPLDQFLNIITSNYSSLIKNKSNSRYIEQLFQNSPPSNRIKQLSGLWDFVPSDLCKLPRPFAKCERNKLISNWLNSLDIRASSDYSEAQEICDASEVS